MLSSFLDIRCIWNCDWNFACLVYNVYILVLRFPCVASLADTSAVLFMLKFHYILCHGFVWNVVIILDD
jgi:hypothetical protein